MSIDTDLQIPLLHLRQRGIIKAIHDNITEVERSGC